MYSTAVHKESTRSNRYLQENSISMFRTSSADSSHGCFPGDNYLCCMKKFPLQYVYVSISAIHFSFRRLSISFFSNRLSMYLDVSQNRGFTIKPPKWMVYFMENPMNKWMIWGYPNYFGNTHFCYMSIDHRCQELQDHRCQELHYPRSLHCEGSSESACVIACTHSRQPIRMCSFLYLSFHLLFEANRHYKRGKVQKAFV